MSITGLSAERAKIDHSEMTWGFPSPTAWAGLANVIGRLTTGQDWKMTCLPIIHDQKVRTSDQLPEGEIKGNKFTNQEAKTRERAFVDFSLILSLPDEMSVPNEKSLLDAVKRTRLAGSPISVNAGKEPDITVNTEDGASLSFEIAAKTVLSKSGLGYMILPWSGSELFYRYEDEVHALLAQIRNGAADRELLFPAMIGYALITDPKSTPGGRNDMRHAFAEPVSGLVEMRLNTRYDDLSHRRTAGFGFVHKSDEVFVNKIYHS